MLVLYPATLMNSFTTYNSFLDASLGFSILRLMPSANRDNLTFSFPFCMSFISFSCLTALTRISSVMLNKSGESGHPCLVPDLRKVLAFPIWHDASREALLYPGIFLLCLLLIFLFPATQCNWYSVILQLATNAGRGCL